MRSVWRELGAGAMAAALLACRGGAAERGREETASGAVTQQGDVARAAQSDRLATRWEPQLQLDSAREAIAAARPAVAVSHLGAAAAFARAAAARADPPLSDSLLALAGDINQLAASIGSGTLVTPRDVVRASGRLNLAEARRHRAQASAAAARRDRAAAGDHLIMTADHLERAARDLRGAVPPFVQQQARAARRLGAALLRRDTHAAAKVPPMLRALDGELRRLERAAPR